MDFEAVRTFIVGMVKRGKIAQLVTEIVSLLQRLTVMNTQLMARVAGMRRSKPPNEAMRRLQLELPFGGGDANAQSSEQGARVADDEPASKPPNKGHSGRPKNHTPHGRPRLPAELARVAGDEQRVGDQDRTCSHCGGEAKTVTLRVTEKLDIIPARFVVRQDKREVVACDCGHHIVVAPKTDEVVDRGLLGNDLLVEAMVDHYQDAVPWERMQRNARAQGVPLSANTVASRVFALIDLFDPVVDHIAHQTLSSDYLNLDATGMPVQDPSLPVRLRSATLWAFAGDHRYSYFAYAKSGHAEHLEKLLQGYDLHRVMADGSATINVVERLGADRGGCNSHARRGLVEALRQGDMRAYEGLELYAGVFHVDAESKRAEESLEERFERRKAQSAPLIEQLREWVDDQLGQVEPQSRLGKSLGYLDRQWKRLTRFLDDPVMELTNNEIERDLRAWVLDRKSWLFCGHDQSAHRAANALTLITTCKKMGIEPRAYLRWALAKILAGEKALAAILPETFLQLP